MARYSFWPDHDQLLLLKFCLLRDPAPALAAWKEWKRRVDLDDLDYPSFRLMSLAYRRLVDLGLDDPDFGRIKGIYRYQWTRNQIAARGKGDLLRSLHAAEIPTLLLKGAALDGTVYKEPAARGMHDLDFLVPFSCAARAMELLRKSGWIAQHFEPLRTIDYFHACSFAHPEFGEVDLHWHAMRTHCDSERDAELWAASRDFTYQGTRTKILCPADQFLQACEHAHHYSPASALQWLADTTLVIRETPDFDWARLIDQTRKFRLTLPVRRTLAYLRRNFEPSIPEGVIAELARLRVSALDRAAYLLATNVARRPQQPVYEVAVATCRYFQSAWRGTFSERLAQYPYYLRLFFHEKREWPVVFAETSLTLRSRWRDDLEEFRFRWHRFVHRQPAPAGGLISRFQPENLHGFHKLETEFGSPFRWTEPKASMNLQMEPAPHRIRIQFRPFRDLTRLAADGLTFWMNGQAIAPERYEFQAPFVTFPIDARTLKPEGRQKLSWCIEPWPAPGDPRQLGLPLSRLWVLREKPSSDA